MIFIVIIESCRNRIKKQIHQTPMNLSIQITISTTISLYSSISFLTIHNIVDYQNFSLAYSDIE